MKCWVIEIWSSKLSAKQKSEISKKLKLKRKMRARSWKQKKRKFRKQRNVLRAFEKSWKVLDMN